MLPGQMKPVGIMYYVTGTDEARRYYVTGTDEARGHHGPGQMKPVGIMLPGQMKPGTDEVLCYRDR